MNKTITLFRKVLFGDCDPEGIVYTPKFSEFALEATHEAMDALLGSPSIRTLKEMGILTPVRALNVEFTSPVTWDQTLKLEVCVASMKRHSYTFLIQGFVDEQIQVFQAEITYVTVSSDKKGKVDLPDKLKTWLSQ